MTQPQAAKVETNSQVDPVGKILPVIATRVETVATGVIAIWFTRADGAEFPAWTAGAHIDLLIGGGLERQYSLCGLVDDRATLCIAVLREPSSRGGSQALHEQLKEGDRLSIREPRNNFPLIDADEYIFIAGGIGITPILPMIATLERSGKPWKLLYGGRSRASMAFRDALSGYDAARVHIQPEDEAGLLDIGGWVGAPRDRCAVFCCGPERLIAAVEAHCADWPEDALRVERFRPADGALEGDANSFEVVLARKGITVQVGPEQTIADALEDVGIHIPRSCNEGTCGTCITKVLEGTPDHRDSFLRGRMRNENKRIMVCCSRALTPRLVLDI
jgi:ferredoxin-NADP reductase